MQEIKRQSFTANQADEVTAAINNVTEIVRLAGGAVVYNFDTSKEINEGYSFIIAPINQRTADNKNAVVGVSIGAVPTYEILSQSEEGRKYISDTINDSIRIKLANAVRPNRAGSISATVPYEVNDFIISNRSDGLLVAYRTLAPGYIKLLKDMGFKGLTDATFRQTLTSAAFAESTFPNIPQDKWQLILTKMIALSESKGMVAGMLAEWLESRNNAGMPELEEIDLSDFDGLI